MEVLDLTISKKGIPCLWEQGGGFTKTGRATIIAGNNGAPKRAIYVRTHGVLACDEHALIPVQPEDYMIHAEHSHGQNFVEVYRIKEINLDEKTAVVESVEKIPQQLSNAVDACVDKSYDYHCRSPYYCIY